MNIIILVEKLPKNKTKRRKHLISTFGSAVVDSGYVFFIEIINQNN